MKHLARLSYAITAMGLLCVAATILLDLPPVWMLAGVMLVLAGVIKIAVVQIWLRIAHLE